MEEQLISFETAKLAKEKGFNWLVTNMFKIGIISKGVIEEDNPYDNVNKLKGSAVWSRPTQSLLQKWLREKHNIYLIVDMGINRDYHFRWFNETDAFQYSKGTFDTYEEALEKGLQEALKLIK